jgi:hypothetical protein
VGCFRETVCVFVKMFGVYIERNSWEYFGVYPP